MRCCDFKLSLTSFSGSVSGMDIDQQNRAIGKRLASLRGDVSQKDLADRMRERGHKWSQATVWAIERGDRPLKLTEAIDVTEALGTTYARLTNSEMGHVAETALQDMASAAADIGDGLQRFAFYRSQAIVAAMLLSRNGEADGETAKRCREYIAKTPADLVADWARRARDESTAVQKWLEASSGVDSEAS